MINEDKRMLRISPYKETQLIEGFSQLRSIFRVL